MIWEQPCYRTWRRSNVCRNIALSHSPRRCPICMERGNYCDVNGQWETCCHKKEIADRAQSDQINQSRTSRRDRKPSTPIHKLPGYRTENEANAYATEGETYCIITVAYRHTNIFRVMKRMPASICMCWYGKCLWTDTESRHHATPYPTICTIKYGKLKYNIIFIRIVSGANTGSTLMMYKGQQSWAWGQANRWDKWQ